MNTLVPPATMVFPSSDPQPAPATGRFIPARRRKAFCRQRRDRDDIGEPGTLLAKRRGRRTAGTGPVVSERFPFLTVDPALAEDAHNETKANILRVRIRVRSLLPRPFMYW